jgi:signal transduction histidine kinase
VNGTATHSAARRSRWHAVGLRARLNLLVTACVLPLLLLALAVEYVVDLRAREKLAVQQLSLARSYAQNVARELQTTLVRLERLAAAAELVSDPVRLHREEQEALGDLPATSDLMVLQPADPRLVGLPGVSLAAPDQSGDDGTDGSDPPTDIVSDLIPADSTHAAQVALCVPLHGTSGDVRWLELREGLQRFQHITLAQQPQPGWTLAVIDGSGIILARWPAPTELIGAPAVPFLGDAISHAADGVITTTTKDGTPVLAAFAQVPGSHWHAVIGIPSAILAAPLLHAAKLTLGAAALTLAVGLLLAQWLARAILHPIQRLQDLAADDHLGVDGAPAPYTGLPEADAVARALVASATTRREATARLQALAATLERRVAQEVATREAAQAAAAHAQRMQALGRLVSGIAHDVNNVLQAAETATGLLRARPNDADLVQRAERLLSEALRRGTAITGRLLSFARRTPPSAAPVNATSLLEGLRELLTSGGWEAVPIRLEVAPALPPLLADRAQLETVLLNLASNAQDAMPSGGELSFGAASEGESATRPPGLPAGRYVRLWVRDTGVGMTPDVLARATEPFFTTKAEGDGTGLGLSLAHDFAVQSGGALTLTSEPGKGTTVSLWLPAAPV